MIPCIIIAISVLCGIYVPLCYHISTCIRCCLSSSVSSYKYLYHVLSMIPCFIISISVLCVVNDSQYYHINICIMCCLLSPILSYQYLYYVLSIIPSIIISISVSPPWWPQFPQLLKGLPNFNHLLTTRTHIIDKQGLLLLSFTKQFQKSLIVLILWFKSGWSSAILLFGDWASIP